MGPSTVNFAVLLVLALTSLCSGTSSPGAYLYPQFYQHSCPRAQDIVRSVVARAVAKEARMAASLLRLHFHDCFVKGCDASLLLDSSGSIVSEKGSNPNKNSARGFEVIDEIKSALEKECPQTVSCADILALAARDSTVLPTCSLSTLMWLIPTTGAAGSHTIGLSRCTSFRQRLYNQTGNGVADSTLEEAYAWQLRSRCPRSGGDDNLFTLDRVSPTKFDNSYYKNIVAGKGLLNSDQVLLTRSLETMVLVKQYAENNELFFDHFAKSIVKMGNISPLTGTKGEIRKNCRKTN
ncbi:hypothetical protein B296_00015152 [Ensete ventricosum]|uniref:Peroxidase n=1 Tax=Ensete ventricosum TaxID=4639 RepID=A0A427AJF3_ENSVE|nr:hypothetical protein B296_00015152 [Ensete ventricosum]